MGKPGWSSLASLHQWLWPAAVRLGRVQRKRQVFREADPIVWPENRRSEPNCLEHIRPGRSSWIPTGPVTASSWKCQIGGPGGFALNSPGTTAGGVQGQRIHDAVVPVVPSPDNLPVGR